MKKLIWIVILLIGIPVFAQGDDVAAVVFQPLEVSNVRLQLSEQNGISLIFNASPAVCEDLLVDIVVDGGYIEVNVFAPNTDSVCNTVAPYEPVIQLPDLDTGQAYVLFLNNYASPFYLNDRGDTSTTQAFAALWGEDNILFELAALPSNIDTVDFDTSVDNFGVTISGTHPDDCTAPEYTRVRQDDVQENLYHIEVFRLLTPIVMCPDDPVAYEVTIPLDVSADDIVEIDDKFYQLAAGQEMELLADTLSIDSVEILVTANSNIVVVEGGFYGNDCGVNRNIHIRERDYATLVDVVSYFPTDTQISCDSPILEESFQVDVLPVIINRRAFDENGEITPNASGQSIDNQTGGNFMVVDTVIESVEVAILESFPMQLQLTVTGYQPDGCDFPVEVAQTVDGNDVSLHIFRNVPPDAMCPMVLVTYEETIMIDGSFEGGRVNIQINEFMTSVDL